MRKAQINIVEVKQTDHIPSGEMMRTGQSQISM